MQRRPSHKFAIILLFALLVPARAAEPPADQQPFGLDRRIPWTTSRVVGSPDPPLPYMVEKTYTNIQWRSPLFAIAEPGTDSLLVVRQGGEKDRPSKILRLRDDPSATQTEPFLQISNRLIYSIAFHPGYQTNGYLYLFSNGPTPRSERTNRISRYTVARQPPHACDPLSERIIIEWRSAGHDGGGLVFGHDGMLYISTGDGTSDSDGWNSGQTLNDLLGAVLRIDVDHTDGTQAYSAPKDNPFVGWTNARPELWAYGLRNPWRMTVDQKTGQIWVGNNGQDLWETAHLVRRGENYGWSVYEGNHPFYLNRKLGPTPLVPPTIEHHHAEARSLTGGVVYYGDRLPDLNGVYVYGDYSSGIIWGARHNGTRVTWHKDLARTELQIAAFAVNHHGELLIVDHGSGIYRLVRAPEQRTATTFPTRLSETGLFISTKDHQLHPGVLPYSVQAPGWADGAKIKRFVALAGDTQIQPTNGWTFPNGAVLMQTLSLQCDDVAISRRIETRLLTRPQGQWVGYSYRWDDAQSDATLVGANGAETEFTVGDRASGAKRRQTWRFPARAECMACHSRAANFVLGFTPLQLDKTHEYGGVRDNQLRALHHAGLFHGPKPSGDKTAIVDPYDSSKDLEARARSYLHVNCSICHVDAGGGNAKMELALATKPETMNLVGAWPQHDTFGIQNAMLVAPGDPNRSILFHRLSRRGRGQMPPLVSTVADTAAIALFRDWIGGIKQTQTFVREWKMEDLLPALDRVTQDRSFESGQTAFRQTGCNQCHRFDGEGGAIGPELTGVARRLLPRDLLESIILPSKVIAEGYAAAAAETGISTMPTGMLNTLDESQVLDLLAYLLSDADPEHAAFRNSSK